jgi:Na+/H+ antiporter NhaC
MTSFFKKKRTIFLSITALVALFLLFYAGDKEYLQEKSADKIWFEFNYTLDQIVGKGDLVTYKGIENNTVNTKWSKYSNRFSEQVLQLNRRNEPSVRNHYLLTTSFNEVEGRVMIKFTISEENTGQLVEEKEIITDPIKYTSVIPAVLALFLCFATARPIISLAVSLFLGSILYNGGSVIMGTKEVFFRYLPYGFVGNNLNMILFLLIISVFLKLLSEAGGFKSLSMSRGPLKYIIFPLLYFHPYAGVTAGSWMKHSFEQIKDRPLRSSFVSHVLAMVISSLLIYNYSGIGLSLFANSLQFRFFSAAALIMLAFFFLFNRTTKSMDSITRDESVPLFQSKDLIKIKPYMSVVFLSMFVVLFILISLFIGMLRLDISPSLFNLSHIKHYLAATNISSALVLSSLLTCLALIFYTLRTRLLNIKDISSSTLSSLTGISYFMFLLLLSFSFSKVLSDMGSAYYIISLFKVKIGTPFFPFVCFIISTATAFMSGNSLIMSALIVPILLPIAGQIGGDISTANAIAAILEGCIAGELLSPYSPTAIMVSSVFKINPVKHASSMFPYIGLVIVASSFIGFMLSGTNFPIWLSYIAIGLFILLTMFKKTVK